METMSQIQNTAVDAAPRPAEPTRVPIQNVSTEKNSVIRSDDATAGSATRAMVRGSGSVMSCAASHSLVTATGASPSCGSTGSDPPTGMSGGGYGGGSFGDAAGDGGERPRRSRTDIGGHDRE